MVDDAVGTGAGFAGGAAATAGAMAARQAAINGASSLAAQNLAALGTSTGPLGAFLGVSFQIGKVVAGVTNIFADAWWGK